MLYRFPGTTLRFVCPEPSQVAATQLKDIICIPIPARCRNRCHRIDKRAGVSFT